MTPLLSIATSLTPLALLACPVGMGLMMFLMMRGGRGRGEDRRDTAGTPAPSIADLKAEHERLAEQIERLEASPDHAEERARR